MVLRASNTQLSPAAEPTTEASADLDAAYLLTHARRSAPSASVLLDPLGASSSVSTMPIQQDLFEQCAMFPTSTRHSSMQGYNLGGHAPAGFASYSHPNTASPNPHQQSPSSSYTTAGHQEYGQFQVSSDGGMMQGTGGGAGSWTGMYSTSARGTPGGGGGSMTGGLDDWTAAGFVPQGPAAVQNHYASYRGTLSSTSGSPSDYLPNTQPSTGSIMTLTGASTPGTTTPSALNVNNAAASRQSRAPYDWMKKQSYPTTPTAGKTRTKDKYRVVYSDHQRLELEKEFHYSRYITIRRKAELAQNLQLSERQVKIWFQNRRAKERKQNKKKGDMAAIIKTDLSAHLHHESPDLSPDQI